MSSSMGNLEAKFNAISPREQKLVFYAVPFVICFVFILGLIEPAITQTIETRQEITDAKLSLVDITYSVDSVQAQLNIDPNTETRNQIVAVNEQILILEQQFTRELEQLVPPAAMPFVLEQLFADAKKLKLIGMSSIVPTNIFENAPQADEKEKVDVAKQAGKKEIVPELFKHGLRISFEGSFFDTREFLLAAEKMPWKLHWQEINFEVDEYPRARVDIELFTLSTSEAYIHVN
ncbi:MAG: MSHA biogenesis protein MshJ [Glaciecola sp.]|jgi:MSHA biogenesis protein MshJ